MLFYKDWYIGRGENVNVMVLGLFIHVVMALYSFFVACEIIKSTHSIPLIRVGPLGQSELGLVGPFESSNTCLIYKFRRDVEMWYLKIQCHVSLYSFLILHELGWNDHRWSKNDMISHNIMNVPKTTYEFIWEVLDLMKSSSNHSEYKNKSSIVRVFQWVE